MKTKRIRNILFGCAALSLHICLCCKAIESYREYQKTLESLNTPLEMAETFMAPEYDARWEDIDKVARGRTDPRFSAEYEILTWIIPNVDYAEYRKYDNWQFIDCERDFAGHTYEKGTDFLMYSYMVKKEVVSNAVRTTEISISLNGSTNVRGVVSDQSRDTGDIESYGFNLTEENGAYVVNGGCSEEDIEKHTGMTLEEVVEIAEKNRQGFEDIMYEMKEHEIKRNKEVYVVRLVLLHLLLVLFLIYLNRDFVKSKFWKASGKVGKYFKKKC